MFKLDRNIMNFSHRISLRNNQGVIGFFNQYSIKRHIIKILNDDIFYKTWSPGAPWRIVFQGIPYFIRKSTGEDLMPFLSKSLSETGFMFNRAPERKKR